jgi:ribosomal-protein-alanine N-acetyltransferase
MKLETDRLILRPFKKSDLNDLAALNGDEEVMKFISPPLTTEQVAGVIDWFISEWQRLGYGWFALFEKQNNRFVGQCGLQCLEGKADSPDVELAFVIVKTEWGKGYATEAAREVAKFGFYSGGLKRVVAVSMMENVPSQRVLEKLGFRFVDKRFLYGREVMYYELTKSNFMAENTREAGS